MEEFQKTYLLPGNYYSQRLENLNQEKQGLSRKDKKFEISRFILFFGGIGGIVFLVLNKSSLVFLFALFLILLYLFIVQEHLKLKEILEEKIRGILNAQRELKALVGDYSEFEEGSRYINPNHDYSSDLDLFGKKSIFQYFNRTLSPWGQDRLATWFLQASGSDIIRERQDSVQELISKPDWVQNFRTIQVSERTQPEYLNYFFKWLDKPAEIQFPKVLLFILSGSPWLLGFLILGILLDINFPSLENRGFLFLTVFPEILGFFFFMQLAITGAFTKRIKQVHEVLTGQGSTLLSYSTMIERVEQESFKTPFLLKIQGQILTEPRASQSLKELAKIIKSFDNRLNILLSVITNGLYLSDIRLVLKLEGWKKRNREKVFIWVDSINEIEALISLSIIGFNEPTWVFPKLIGKEQSLEIQNMGHPLIPVQKRITNSFQIIPPNQVVLITGSNMAGKSTFLRTIGVNLILAQMGSKVCAEEFLFEPVQIYTSLRIVDSLQENTSSFYAELKRLEVLVKRSLRGENIFFLLDEILRGTNSNDRHLGSEAVIKHLIRNHVFGILATHDLSLGEMIHDFHQEIRNMHFDVSVRNDELFFDYTLKPGICTSLNASILMRKIGLEIDS